MNPCRYVFGTIDQDHFPLDVMFHALRAGDYEPVVDDAGEWNLMEGRAVLRHVTSTMPRIRFSSLLGTHPAPGDAIAAALACIAPEDMPVRPASLTLEARIDALMSIAVATGSTRAEIGCVRMMQAPTPWSAVRTRILHTDGGIEEAPSDGEGIEHIPVCSHLSWQTRIEPPRPEPLMGLQIEPIQTIVHPNWGMDPIEAIRILRSAQTAFAEETYP